MDHANAPVLKAKKQRKHDATKIHKIKHIHTQTHAYKHNEIIKDKQQLVGNMASKFRTTYGKGVAVELMSNSIDNGSLAHLSIDRERERELKESRSSQRESASRHLPDGKSDSSA